MRKKQAARQRSTAVLAVTALLLALVVSDAGTSAVANETFTDAHDPDFLVLNPEGE